MHIKLFGPFAVHVDGRSLPPLRSRRGQWLLALLALQAGREVGRRWLAGLLWPESSFSQGLYNVRRALAELRAVLGQEAWRLYSPSPHTLALDLTGSCVDVVEFDAAIERGDPASLARAVALYRGPLLQECDEEWILPERAARAEAYLAALERLATHAATQGDPAAAVHFLRRLVATDPLRDSGQRALMRALAAGGDVAAAAQVYHDFRFRLHRELNAAPDPETISLYQQIWTEARQRQHKLPAPACGASRPVEERPCPEAPWRLPRPLTRLVGREAEVCRLRELLLPRDEGHAHFAGTRMRDEGGTIPSHPSSLIPHPPRLVTLTGPGGVGKTRLAIQVAEEVSGEFRDGACFVDLTALTDPSLVPQAAAAALAVREQPGHALTDAVQEFLRGKELLLVLDNCEHLLAGTHEVGGCAELATALLTGCPGLRLLATSRQSLGITGETVWPVPALSLPPVEGVGRWAGTRAAGGGVKASGSGPDPQPPTPSALLQFGAVRLFVERARSTTPAFALTERTAERVAEVCRQLDGIPLAIELAAARLKALSVDEIAARLGDHLSLLTGGSRTALPRQQTLRATLDWSYDLLSEPERCLLRRLSVFAGAFTLEAAEVVYSDCQPQMNTDEHGCRLNTEEGAPAGSSHPCASVFIRGSSIQNEEVLDLLTGLVDKSLVEAGLGIVNGQPETPPDNRQPPTPSSETRYRLLETVRQYARERLRESGEEATAQGRHEQFYLRLAEAAVPYLGLAEKAAPYLVGPDQIAWLERLDGVQDDLRAALDSSLAHAPGTALRLAAALAGFWEEQRYLEEGRRWLAAALERAGPGRRSLAGAAVLAGASALALLQEDYRSARHLLEESLAIREELGDRGGSAASLAHLAHLMLLRDDYPTARALYEESLAIQKERGDPAGIATVLTGLGHLARREGEYLEAVSLHEESLATRRALGDRYGISQSLNGLGDAVIELGDTAAARAHYEEALAIRRELGDQTGVAGTLGELANVARRQGDYAEARRLRQESLALWRAIGSRVAVLHSLGALGHLAREQGDCQEARRFYAESLLLQKELGDPYTLAQSLEDFAELAAADRQWPRMVRLLGAAHALRDAVDKPLRPRERADYDRLLTAARGALLDAAVAAAWEAGRAMILPQGTGCVRRSEQAIAYALEDGDSSRGEH